jgi:hypothetical protein
MTLDRAREEFIVSSSARKLHQHNLCLALIQTVLLLRTVQVLREAGCCDGVDDPKEGLYIPVCDRIPIYSIIK